MRPASSVLIGDRPDRLIVSRSGDLRTASPTSGRGASGFFAQR